jgi:chromosome segregation ATPase
MEGVEDYSKKSRDMHKNISFVSTPLIFLSAVAIMLLVSTVALYNTKESEKKSRMDAQYMLDETRKAKQALELRLRDMEAESAAVKASLKDADEKIAVLSKYLEDEQALAGPKAAEIKERDAEILRLQARLEYIEAERSKLAGDIEKLNYEYMRLEFYFKNIMQAKEELDKKAKELAEREGVSLGTIVVKQGSK